MKKIVKDRAALACLIILVIIVISGIYAPVISSYNLLEGSLTQKFKSPSLKHLLGTD